MFPERVSLDLVLPLGSDNAFKKAWSAMMAVECHSHPVWKDRFVQTLDNSNSRPADCFALASVWSINMVAGSYCFPRYAAALAARAEQDAVRHGLLGNAWDESGSYGHTCRSHFWLAVKLARLLGLSDSEIGRICPLPEAQVYSDEHYRECVAGDFGFAFGMICLIEEFTTPEFTLIFKAFLRSCKEGMDVEPDDFVLKGGAEYFTANIADDERHREEMPRLVATWLHVNGIDLSSPTEVKKGLEPVRAGARYSADLRQKFFDGIYRFIMGGGTFRELILS